MIISKYRTPSTVVSRRWIPSIISGSVILILHSRFISTTFCWALLNSRLSRAVFSIVTIFAHGSRISHSSQRGKSPRKFAAYSSPSSFRSHGLTPLASILLLRIMACTHRFRFKQQTHCNDLEIASQRAKQQTTTQVTLMKD